MRLAINSWFHSSCHSSQNTRGEQEEYFRIQGASFGTVTKWGGVPLNTVIIFEHIWQQNIKSNRFTRCKNFAFIIRRDDILVKCLHHQCQRQNNILCTGLIIPAWIELPGRTQFCCSNVNIKKASLYKKNEC